MVGAAEKASLQDGGRGKGGRNRFDRIKDGYSPLEGEIGDGTDRRFDGDKGSVAITKGHNETPRWKNGSRFSIIAVPGAEKAPVHPSVKAPAAKKNRGGLRRGGLY
ncbi:hypothetical protein MASR1M66_13950 [Aminivibrio sp.]